MALIWNGTPTFTSGQILSASAHLDTLSKCVGQVYDRVFGYSTIFSGQSKNATTLYGMRHKSDLLHITCDFTGSFTVKINNTTVLNVASGTSYDGEVNISALGIALNELYGINVSGTGSLAVYALYERVVTTYPTLVAFTQGTTPTAAEWQALSTYAEALNTDTSLPMHPTNLFFDYADCDFYGCAIYRGGMLNIRLMTTRNYNSEQGAHPKHKNDALIYINGTLAATLTNNNEADGYGPAHRIEKSVTINPASYGATLGAIYKIHIFFDTVSVPEMAVGICFSDLQQCEEVPVAVPTLAGWTSMTDWTHGDTVNGSTTSKTVKPIRDNMVLLNPVRAPYNFACMASRQVMDNLNEKDRAPLRFIRKHRFLLYYYNFTGVEGVDTPPAITIKYGVEKTYVDKEGRKIYVPYEQSLDEANNTWKVLDLASIPGLWPGTPYELFNATLALEDSSA